MNSGTFPAVNRRVIRNLHYLPDPHQNLIHVEKGFTADPLRPVLSVGPALGPADREFGLAV